VSFATAVVFSLDLGFFCFFWGSEVFIDNLFFFYCGQNSDMFVVLLSIQVRPGYSSLTDVILMCNS